MDKYAEQVNELFKLGLDRGGEAMEKVADELADYIKLEIREAAFSTKILPQENVDKSDLIPELNEDTFYTIEELEPSSKAVILNLRSQPESHYIQGKRVKVEFFTVASERSEKSQTELLAYKMPITRVLQENDVKEMYKKEDQRFYTLMKNAVMDTGLIHLANGGVAMPSYELKREQLIDGIALHSSNGTKLKTTQMLMTENRFFDILKWDAMVVGDDIAGNVTKRGWDEAELFGKRLIVTNKNDTTPLGTAPVDANLADIWEADFDDEIWFFTSPAYMGKNYILDKLNFDLGKKGRMIYWESWKDIAMAILNTKSVTRLSLNPAEYT